MNVLGIFFVVILAFALGVSVALVTLMFTTVRANPGTPPHDFGLWLAGRHPQQLAGYPKHEEESEPEDLPWDLPEDSVDGDPTDGGVATRIV